MFNYTQIENRILTAIKRNGNGITLWYQIDHRYIIIVIRYQYPVNDTITMHKTNDLTFINIKTVFVLLKSFCGEFIIQ